ncbi:hypothetical protein SYJ56_04600 [Algoriphagus sp. D3-2-R+10]|uniref:hypothetical protein n=1 Tax=Algoriphagus aurantiacus TaxID=3103948 RepID=UPI002B39DD53|nr:hypothetical protein [Algoriphagus sp. D3-2-R+10]MEB2774572.1 hypothetical protein [Algoriphagus sp. D3-2-R+10]
MGNGDYINKLVKGVRGEIGPAENELKVALKPRKKRANKSVSSDINELLETMRNFEIKGDNKRLIRIDSRTEEVLKLLSPTFRVDVTSFVNFLCWDFLENNPELINEIKQTLKKL